ncbi:unnamed protein product [Pocillopora meandrina]|uniref:Uncharacterized protein n=1 Tax=Pocillopora meandrina TaxID=46732 RepID=A0AAU9XSM5_9CNID|nr:unnamed protein product [Pocillopora meandrina]
MIKIGVFDEGKVSDDESLGTYMLRLTLVQLSNKGNVALWLPLENVKSGQINLRCTWFTLTAKPEDLSPPDQAIIGEEMLATAALFVKLDSAKNLP